MSALDQIVDIVITQETAAIPQPSFSIPLIVGPNATATLAYYTAASDLLTAGFTTSDPEYIYAVELTEQALVPVTFGVGKRTAAVAQVDTFMVGTLIDYPSHIYMFTVNGHVLSYASMATAQVDTIMVNTLTEPHDYTFTINGNALSYTSGVTDTQQSILTALNAALAALPTPPATGIVTGTGSGATLTLTSVTPGVALVYTAVDSKLTEANVTPNHADSQQYILGQLNTQLAAITPTPPGVGVVTLTGPSAVLTITSSTPGQGINYTAIDADLTHANPTPNNGIQNDLENIINATNGNLWYGLCLCSNQSYDILQAASFIEATGNRIFVAASNDSNIPTALTTDLASQLKALSYKRTGLMYSPVSYDLGMDAAWLGGQLPQTPGASTWDLKNLVGIAPDSFTSTQLTNMIGTPGVGTGKNVNIFTTVGGQNITQNGTMAGGQYIDVTVFIDWLRVTMQNAIFLQMVNNPKIPYTDKGLAIIENQVRNVLIQGSDAGGSGGIDSTTIVVNAVSVASIPQNYRAMRYVPAGSITFSCRLTGAVQNVVISGNVTV